MSGEGGCENHTHNGGACFLKICEGVQLFAVKLSTRSSMQFNLKQAIVFNKQLHNEI